jgi:2-deoxy-scyllo-inosamine dehydrogenase (SAM-dependent)
MDDTLFKHIIAQLADLDFAGRLSFHLFNEPLLRRDLEHLVAHARGALPRAWLVIYTNGDLLSDKRYAALLGAGIDKFIVTRHGGKPMASRPFQTVQFPGQFMLSSRGGLIGTQKMEALPCFAPSEILIIRDDGAVVLCHEDASSQKIMGFTDQQSLREIWFCEEFMLYRRVLAAGNRLGAGGPCAVCDHRLYAVPDSAITG